MADSAATAGVLAPCPGRPLPDPFRSDACATSTSFRHVLRIAIENERHARPCPMLAPENLVGGRR